MNNHFIEIKEIDKSYSSKEKKNTILKNINLKITQGELIAIVGESGAGKSTLLNVVGGLDQVDKGSIIINNQAITNLKESKLAYYRNQNIGFIFQQHHLLKDFTAFENLMIPQMIYLKNKKEAEEKALSLLKKVDLLEQKNHLTGELSGGELQRIAIARAIINKPKIILADEPTGNLDTRNSEKIFNLLLALSKKNKTTVIIVTHSLSLSKKCHKIYKLKEGALKILT